MIYSEEDIIWLAGWLEGEGCFYVGPYSTVKAKKKYTYTSFQIKASATDKDVIERVAFLLGSNVTGPYQNQSHHTPYYKVQLSRRADVITWCERLLPHMGRRRSARIEEILAAHKRLKEEGK